MHPADAVPEQDARPKAPERFEGSPVDALLVEEAKPFCSVSALLACIKY